MQYKKMRIFCGLMVAGMVATSLSACTSSSTKTAIVSDDKNSTENKFEYTDGSDIDDLAGKSVMGTVTKVDGSTITLSVMEGGGQPPLGEAPSEDRDSSLDDKKEMPKETDDNSESETTKENSDKKEMPEMETKEATLTISDESVLSGITLLEIEEGSNLEISFDDDGNISSISLSEGFGGGQPPQGQSSGVDSYDAVTEYSEDTEESNESYTSTNTDENAILVSNGANVTLDNITVDRTSSDSTGGDNSSFYGVGAAILTIDGTTNITNANISTDAAGGAGVFAYADGVVNISDSTIYTKQNTSGGIHVAGGGTLYANNLNVTTEGESAAAIRSDRGGGTMIVDQGTYTSNGVGSPAVYCTADIAVNNATLKSNGSEAICMEGFNNLYLYDCDISGNMQDLEANDTTWDIIVYQSMSGDAEVGNATMQIVGGSLEAKNGGLIYTTNTQSNILLSDVDITYSDDSEFFLMATGNTNSRGWGNEGENGADCTFTADSQEMSGKVIWDSISQLDFYMTNASTLTGSFEDDETYAGNGGDGYCNVYISSDSKWIVTSDSTVTNLYCEGTILDENQKTVSIVGTDGTVYVEGTSDLTITVESYGDSVDLSGAALTTDFECPLYTTSSSLKNA
ncbi:hypothetical protein SAMN05216249_108105 [Acetitomaculum ruminis DSM 5522]|uniref:Right handed beta helix region n=1 Tax=Acetitomaculum ruminis DSM 5522 TaxID=1120918 RepID=A0A1I0Y3N4_9FIRM|nr:hypothetical protein [Acetitomaculum ruminis]SFB07782.1 hypothetical protein SAMN05216249_108105 [Acetitomaculum ruminis DSM 5522]